MNNDKRVKSKMQSPKERINNFNEVEFGYNDIDAKKEADRCLQCNNPRCVKGCPVNISIPNFIKAIKDGDIKLAYQIISDSSSLPAVCGRVCPQEKQCEKMCIKGLKGDAISIGALERYVADYAIENSLEVTNKVKKNGLKVAIVGAGPAGISCAGLLAVNGYDVTIYEVLHKAGGVLTYGIPEFRLPKKIVKKEIDNLEKLGVKIICDVPIGNAISLNELQKEYDAVFIGNGAGLPKFMDIPGEDANEVFAANEILTRINLMGAYKTSSKTPIKKGKIAYVIGGGNVAMDAVRSLKRLGMEAHLMYRRSMDELPARKVEVEHAIEEGIIFDLLKNPKKIIVDENNHVIGMEIVDMEFGEEDESKRRSVKEVIGSNRIITCDMVVEALGTNPNHEALKNSNIKLDEKGLIIVNDSKTSLSNVFAGGDIVTGSATVILAMEAGKKAALAIINYLSSN